MPTQAVTLGSNLDASLDGVKLTIVIDLSKRQGMSKSGKNAVIATTSGNQNVVCDGKIVKLGINCYTGE